MVFIDQNMFIQIILTGLIVGNIAAITLSVSGLKHMHSLAEEIYKLYNPNPLKNKRIPDRLRFYVLENTYITIALFSISELSTVFYVFLRLFNFIDENLVWVAVGMLFFFLGIFWTLGLYTRLRIAAKRKILILLPSTPTRPIVQYTSIEGLFYNP